MNKAVTNGSNGSTAPFLNLTRDTSSRFSTAPGPSIPQSGAFAPVVTKALQEVLGWKINTEDSKGFVNALNQSFDLSEFEGHVVAKWDSPSYAVQTDLSGGISGAQASLYTMAKTILDQVLPILSGLYALRPAAKPEYITAIRGLVRSQLAELVSELGMLGGPRVVRVNQYFKMLLGGLDVPADPDLVHGALGDLRDQMGLKAGAPSFSNSVSDEQNVTNFRVVVDYVLAILNSWTNSRQYFETQQSPFLGTQLVWLSRQLGVVSEVVDELRFLLDSVFIGPAERETLLLSDMVVEYIDLSDITLESLLVWIQNFATSEAPAVIQAGGRYGIGTDFVQMVSELKRYACGLAEFAQKSDGLAGLRTSRVHNVIEKLRDHLNTLLLQTAKIAATHLPPKTSTKPGGGGAAIANPQNRSPDAEQYDPKEPDGHPESAQLSPHGYEQTSRPDVNETSRSGVPFAQTVPDNQAVHLLDRTTADRPPSVEATAQDDAAALSRHVSSARNEPQAADEGKTQCRQALQARGAEMKSIARTRSDEVKS